MTHISIQGTRGSYSEMAARKIDPAATIIECDSFRSAARFVERGSADYALLPVANSIIGSIDGAITAIKDFDLKTTQEVILEIDHVLAAPAMIPLNNLREICSHPAALSQCARFVASLTHAVAQKQLDTAGSLKTIVAQNDLHAAAICSRNAAREYNATIIAESISDRADNSTAFALLS